jgi:transcriptional regulator with XRE-family HTH domain
MGNRNNTKTDKPPAKRQAAAEIVRDARRRCGFTQQQFAAALGITWQYVSQIENAKYVPSAKVMQDIEKVLSEKGIPSTLLSPTEAALIDAYRLLPTEARLAVDSVVSALIRHW